jgi:hypothetical protein
MIFSVTSFLFMGRTFYQGGKVRNKQTIHVCGYAIFTPRVGSTGAVEVLNGLLDAPAAI